MDISQKGKLSNIKTYKVVTFGCQMNAHDSEKLSGILLNMGYIEATDEKVADIVIFNTCTVRENANMKLYGHIGYLKNICEKNKNKIIGICGCMMQEPDEVEKIIQKYPYIKLIFGTRNIYNFEALLRRVLDGEKRVVEIIDTKNMTKEDVEKETYDSLSSIKDVREYKFKCGVNIMYGCDNFCTYCIVPYVRGRERSRDVQDILDEIKNDVNDSVVEVMLLGQNVNSYKGKYEGKEYSFVQLLNEVCKIDGLKRVRFMTSHPKDLSSELIDTIRDNEKICRHIHLPVQSGSNKILGLMNRHYTREKYLDIIKEIRNKIKDIAITTDIIVGFPNETEEDFNETLSLIEEVNFDSVFTFEYSKRTGTKAATMDNQVDTLIVKDRFRRLLDTVEKSAGKNAIKYVGKEMEVLVESFDEKQKIFTGRTSNNYLVHFYSNENLIGKLINVKITKSHGFYFDGEYK